MFLGVDILKNCIKCNYCRKCKAQDGYICDKYNEFLILGKYSGINPCIKCIQSNN